MLQYSVNDILKKAKQLADLENSSYISYNESMTLLNEAYGKLYQTAINAGDLLYVKKMTLKSDDEIEKDGFRIHIFYLPEDFYQLYSVKAKVLGMAGVPIYRRIKDGPLMERAYEIKNNCLYIYGAVHSIDVEYFPVPRTLYIKNNPIKLDEAYGKPLAFYKDVLITESNNTINAIKMTDNSSLGTWNIPESTTIKKCAAGINGLIVWFNDGSTLFSDFNEEGEITPSDSRIMIREDDGIFLDENPTGDTLNMLVTETEVYSITSTPGGKEMLNGEIELSGKNNMINLFEDGKLFITSNENFITIYDVVNDVMSFDGNRVNKIVNIGDYSIENGYGYLVHNRGRGYSIESCFEDTSLDYPNNFYFTMLAYLLAMSYKIKQNGDISALKVAYDSTEHQYYDTLNRDVNQPLRMNNVVYR